MKHYRWVVWFAWVFGVLIVAQPALGKEPQKLIRKRYDVRQLIYRGDVVTLEVLIEGVVEPESWASSGGGEGNIESKGRGILVITQTAENHKRVAGLVNALGQLYPGRRPRPASGPSRPRASRERGWQT